MMILLPTYRNLLLIYESKFLILAKNESLEICKRLLQNRKNSSYFNLLCSISLLTIS